MTKKIIFAFATVLLLSSCQDHKIETPCDCVDRQLELMETGREIYDVTLFGLCSELTKGKTIDEIFELTEVYKSCEGYDKLEAKHMPKGLLENVDTDAVKTILDSLSK